MSGEGGPTAAHRNSNSPCDRTATIGEMGLVIRGGAAVNTTLI